FVGGNLACESGPADAPIEHLVAPCLASVSFMTRNGASKIVTTLNGLKLCGAPAVTASFRTKYDIVRVVTAPFVRSVCRGRVFVFNCAGLADNQLPLLEIVADRVGLELEHSFLQREVELASTERERSRVAHDLHDGILQSLTAVSLSLKN